MRARLVAFAAGVGLCGLATGTLGDWPLEPGAREPVTAVVRTDLGQLKWVKTQATAYTPLEEQGRKVYMRGGCMYCHSQYVRPVALDTRPWGPVSADTRRWGPLPEPGERTFDPVPMYGPGGIGPDLSREGLKYSDEWHLAHFWNPPMMTKGSIMGGFSGLFDAPPDAVKIVDDATSGGSTLDKTPVTQRFFDFASKEQVKLTPNADGLLFVPMEARGKYPLVWMPNKEFAGDSVKLVAETKDIVALTAYIQKLGMNRGQWRDLVTPDETDGAGVALPRSEERIAAGKIVFERRCIACHGAKGDGNGWAATFLYRQRPRNFTLGEFKFRLTKGPLPSDADLLRTITRGVRGTAMPAWFELPLDDRLAVMQYVKYELTADKSDPDKPAFYFVDEPPGPPLAVGTPPVATPEMVAHGGAIWLQAKCWECHGKTGHGDGQKAPGLKDDWGFPIRPANLARGQFKSGPGVADIYRTISTGLTGTPMPSFHDAFPDADRWALAYYILSLSAFSDPLTGNALPIGKADRAALDNPKLVTAGPEHAYGPLQPAAARTE
jgi:cytochrome c oxidase cbb3-type subunit I/II